MHSRMHIKLAADLGLRFGPIRKGVTPKRILDHILQDMTRLQADNVVASDSETLANLAGMWEAYRNVAHYIAPLTDIKNNGILSVPVGVTPATTLLTAGKR